MENKQIEELAQAIANKLIVCQKPVLNLKEACAYLGVSPHYLYRLTSEKRIPHFKPNGGQLFFDRAELDNWVLRNRITPNEEIISKAQMR